MNKNLSFYQKLFNDIEKDFKIDLSGIKSPFSEYPKKYNDIPLSYDEIIKKEKEDIFLYTDIDKINNIVNFQKRIEEIKGDTNLYECCICYEEVKKIDTLYTPCNHNVCIKCSQYLKKNICPMCRGNICETYGNTKFCIVCLGEKTEKYTFDNNGYKSIKLLILPKYNNSNIEVFRNITYHNDCSSKNKFVNLLQDLYSNGYSIILQDKPRTLEWLKYMYIDIYINDIIS